MGGTGVETTTFVSDWIPGGPCGPGAPAAPGAPWKPRFPFSARFAFALISTVWIVPFLMFFDVTIMVAAVPLAAATAAATTAATSAFFMIEKSPFPPEVAILVRA
jgi:hypothetical protein